MRMESKARRADLWNSSTLALVDVHGLFSSHTLSSSVPALTMIPRTQLTTPCRTSSILPCLVFISTILAEPRHIPRPRPTLV